MIVAAVLVVIIVALARPLLLEPCSSWLKSPRGCRCAWFSSNRARLSLSTRK